VAFDRQIQIREIRKERYERSRTGEGDNLRYERTNTKETAASIEQKRAKINSPKDNVRFEKGNSQVRQSHGAETEGLSHEHSANGSTGKRTLESDESGNLSANGRGQGTRRGKRGSSQTDNEGNEDLDVGGLDGSGSLAGEPTPIHLQDSGADSESISAGTGRERNSYTTRLATGRRAITEADLDTAQVNQRKDSLINAKRNAFREKRAQETTGEVSHEENNHYSCPYVF